MLNVAVDCSWFGLTGIGRFADEIVSRSPSDVAVLKIKEYGRNVHALAPLELGLRIRQARADVFWSPGFIPAAGGSRTPQAVTVHDLLHVHRYSAFHRLYYQAIVRPLLRRTPLVFTVSAFSRNELIEWADLSPDRVVAVPHGLARGFRHDGPVYAIDAPYLLYVGNRRAYKNLPRLFRAFASAALASEGLVLALTGLADPALGALARSLGIESQLRWLGEIPESDLAAVYRGARAVAFVSQYEGFGFPIIEAMGCGTPVLTSDASAMPEVAGGAAELVDPHDDDSIAAGLRRVCLDEALRARCREAGLARAKQFDWDRAAATYWAALKQLGATAFPRPSRV